MKVAFECAGGGEIEYLEVEGNTLPENAVPPGWWRCDMYQAGDTKPTRRYFCSPEALAHFGISQESAPDNWRAKVQAELLSAKVADVKPVIQEGEVDGGKPV